MHLQRVGNLGNPGRRCIMGEFDHDSASSDPDRGSLRCDLRARFPLGDLAENERRKNRVLDFCRRQHELALFGFTSPCRELIVRVSLIPGHGFQ